MCVVRSPRMENLCRLISLILLIKKINHVQSKPSRLAVVVLVCVLSANPVHDAASTVSDRRWREALERL